MPPTVGRQTSPTRSAPAIRCAVRWLGSQRPASTTTSGAADRSDGSQRSPAEPMTDSAMLPGRRGEQRRDARGAAA